MSKRRRKPDVPITSQEFKYVPSHATDLRATFARVRAELAEKAKQKAKAENVQPINERRKSNA